MSDFPSPYTPIFHPDDPRVTWELERGAGVGTDARYPPYRPFTGVGSRKAPAPVLELCASLSSGLRASGYSLRSGGAGGCDEAFESPYANKHPMQEIYLPWKKFNQHPSPYHLDRLKRKHPEIFYQAMELAAKNHPMWSACSNGARLLHTRNVLQVLGWNLEIPSEFLLCWTSAGLEGGGTGQAIRIARKMDVPVYNLKSPEDRARLWSNFNWSGTLVDHATGLLNE